MTMFSRFLEFIKRLFGKQQMNASDASDAARQESQYRRIDEINFAAIFGNKLASLALSDAALEVVGADGGSGGQRTDLIADALQEVFGDMNRLCAQALGSGGRVLIPYVADGELRCDVVAQDRMFVHAMRGRRIVNATFVADSVQIDNSTYYRLTDYELEDGGQRIRNRAVDDGGRDVALEDVEAFAGIPEEVFIPGIDRLTFVFLKSPAGSRLEKDVYGVPITYGCDSQIEEIRQHMKLIAREYKLTRPMLGLDSALWKTLPDGSRSIDSVKATVQDSDMPFIPVENYYGDTGSAPWMIFSPAIRDTAMYNRLDRMFEMLEKSVGVSRGILTQRESALATATEIRAANHDTFAFVSNIRDTVQSCMEDLAWCFDVLAEAFGLSPAGSRGDYSINISWDMSLFESSAETFAQYSELHTAGVLSDAELRAWVTGEKPEAAQKAVEEARKERDVNSPIDRILSQQPYGGEE